MTSHLNPFLTFDRNAREAMEFYRSVFGGTLNVSTFGEFGGGGDDVPADGVMHASLETDRGFKLFASDAQEGLSAQIGPAITISVSGDDGDDLRGYWAALTEGGQIQMALEKQVWGDEFGMCTDRYGIPWMVNINQAQA